MAVQIIKPKKIGNKLTEKWLCELYNKNLSKKDSEETLLNLVTYFKTLKKISNRQITLDEANRTRHIKK